MTLLRVFCRINLLAVAMWGARIVNMFDYSRWWSRWSQSWKKLFGRLINNWDLDKSSFYVFIFIFSLPVSILFVQMLKPKIELNVSYCFKIWMYTRLRILRRSLMQNHMIGTINKYSGKFHKVGPEWYFIHKFLHVEPLFTNSSADSSSLQFKPEEITGIMNDFAEPGTLAPTGLYLGGTKYMVIQGEPGAVIRGKKVRVSVIIY